MLCRAVAFACLAVAACRSAPAPDAGPPPIEVQVLRSGANEFDEGAWSAPLERHPRLISAHLGQVLVPGVWTVYYKLAAEDGAWLDRLRKEHGNCRVTWAGLVLNGGGSGYIMHMHGKVHAEQVLAQLPWSLVRRE